MAHRTIKTLVNTGRLSRTKVLSVLKTMKKQTAQRSASKSNGTLSVQHTASGQGLIQFRASKLFKKSKIASTLKSTY